MSDAERRSSRSPSPFAALRRRCRIWMPGIYYINVASQILFYAIFALGLNMLVGYGGLVSLGHAGLFGIAAYATGYLLSERASATPRRSSARWSIGMACDGACLRCWRCAPPASASS